MSPPVIVRIIIRRERSNTGGAATYAAYKKALADGRIAPHESAVLFNCATGLKYPLPPVENRLDRHGEIDYSLLVKS